jgi:hypothetical protein
MKAAGAGVPLTEVIAGIISGAYSAAITGSGMFEIVSSSDAGQSVTQAPVPGSPTRSDIGEAAELLLTIAAWVLEENPGISGEELCNAIRAELPLRPINRVSSRFHTMGPHL